MDFCCPSPDYPAIPPNPDNLKYRRYMRYLMYGQIPYIFAKMMIYGTMSGIFQFINLWMIYTCWATMHFCNALIYLICVGLTFLMIMMDFSRYAKYLTGFYLCLFWLMIIYDAIAMYVTFKAYKQFKRDFENVHGAPGGGYSLF